MSKQDGFVQLFVWMSDNDDDDDDCLWQCPPFQTIYKSCSSGQDLGGYVRKSLRVEQRALQFYWVEVNYCRAKHLLHACQMK